MLYLIAEKIAEGDTSWAINEYQPDYLVLHKPIWKISGATDEILEDYEIVKEIDSNIRIDIYERKE